MDPPITFFGTIKPRTVHLYISRAFLPDMANSCHGVTGATVDNSSEKKLMHLLIWLSRFITLEILTSSYTIFFPVKSSHL